MRGFGLILAILFLLIPASAGAADIPVESDIISVVVFPDRALVTRSANVSLVEGQHFVHFLNLPPGIDQDSIQMSGKGEAGVRLLWTEAKRNVLERPRAEAIAQLEAEIQDVRDLISAVEARLQDLQAEDDLVHAIGVYTGEQFSKEFITCEPQPGEWAAMVEFQRENLARLSENILHSHIQKRELHEQLDALLRKLEELQVQAARESLDVTVSLSASQPGEFQLLLSYVIFGANWYPSYEARAKTADQQVQFTAVGNVRQQTGENWKNTALSLSTARPAIGAVMPELSPWILRPRPPILEGESFDQGFELRREKTLAAAAPAEVAEAAIIQQETSVTFAAPYKADIPSDNTYHRVTLVTDNLKADFSYTATPKLSPYAYLIGEITNTTGAYWLPGKATVFVGENMIGSVPLDAIAPGEEFTLSFGIDEGISVEREELVRREDESRIFGKRKEHYFKDRLVIANSKAKEVNVTLIDQIPVSQHEDIRIADVKFSVAPAERDQDTGLVKWKLPLPPNEKKEIVIEFTVVYPLEMDVFGL